MFCYDRREKMDVLCIGSAVVDIAASPVGECTGWKEKQRIDKIQIQAGGDALNQSIRLADEGIDVALVSCLGADMNGKVIQSALAERRVCVEYLVIKNTSSTGTALVLVDENGNRHTFSVQGAHSELAKEHLEGLPLPKAVSLASLFSMPSLEADGLKEYLKTARDQGVLIFADLASDKKKQGLDGIIAFLPYLDYFLPSEYDALEMTHTTSAEDAAKVYLSCGVKNVVIKCGERGCYYSNGNTEGWVPAKKVVPVDTTGAGDCMVALFISRILCGASVKEACMYACEGASLSTCSYGASAKKIQW